MWYLKACRSCLTTNGNFEKIGPQARRLFCAITGLQLDEGDGFPQYFCAECYVHIKKTLQFRRRSRRAHFVLKEIDTIKKQVAQSDVEKVDRIKTNLISPYSLWKPEETVYSYITPDAIHTDEVTSDIEAAIKDSLGQPAIKDSLGQPAIKDSLGQPAFHIQCNSETKTITIDIKPVKQDLDGQIKNTEKKPTVGELTKLELETLNSSSILVDIKPANWREIEKEEEEKRKRERQAEIDAAVHEIHADDNFDDVCNDIVAEFEDIDMEDVFKGLKDESEKESDSEPEMEPLPLEVPIKKTNAVENKRRANKLPSFLKTRTYNVILEMLMNIKIRVLTLEEQKERFNALLAIEPLKSALYKCGICLTVFCTVHDLCLHVAYHNEKAKYPYMCKVCKDRFVTEEELDDHGGLLHWYKYGCPNCKEVHYTLKSLADCNNSVNRLDWQIKREFIIRALPPKDMYTTLDAWSGAKNEKRSCGTCKIYFQTAIKYKIHMKRHQIQECESHFQCDICNLRFHNSGFAQHKAVFETHMARWHMYSYECRNCNALFRNRSQAIEHLSTKHIAYMCYVCNEKFMSKKEFGIHRSSAHKVDCNMCTHCATDKPSLMLHQLITHGYIRLNTVAELNDIRFYCKKCKIYFTNEKLWFHHLASNNHPAAKKYKNGCISCTQLFDTMEERDAHECISSVTIQPTPIYPRKCSDCDEVCATPIKYRVHRAIVHSDKSQVGEQDRLCETCGKVVSMSYYYQHKSKHIDKEKPLNTNEVQIPCRFCPMKSTTNTNHISHIIYNHTGKPYLCTKCNTRFPHRFHCREHILKIHAPVMAYACEACNRNFAHLDFLHEHCSKAHGVNLKKTDKSVFLSKRMFGKIYVYPDMKIDGSLIDLNILEQTPVEVCDYMDENNRIIDFKEAFFFDPDVDPSTPTRHPPPPKTKSKKKRTAEEERIHYQKRKLKKQLEKMKKEVDSKGGENSQEIIMGIPSFVDSINFAGETLDIKEDDPEDGKEEEIETEDVMGQLIEKDGEHFVLVDGVLYSLEEDCIENLKATGETQSVVLQ